MPNIINIYDIVSPPMVEPKKPSEDKTNKCGDEVKKMKKVESDNGN